MELFNRLFGSLLVFAYHCFDRVVIDGYLPKSTKRFRCGTFSGLFTTVRVASLGFSTSR